MKQLRINFQNIQAAHTTQYQKNKHPSKKVGKRPNRHFSKEDIQIANKHMKNAQHHSLLEKCDISLHTGQNGHHQSLQTINAGMGMEKRERSFTVGGNVS